MGLYNRLKKDLGNKVGYKMGFGARECTDDTEIYFVTTGYLVQFLGGHRSAWEGITHLIIDEVHERSMDGDVICLFAKSVLKAVPKLRIILMSATIHVDMYKSYFGCDDVHHPDYFGPIECLSVGARRFPVKILVNIQYIDIKILLIAL
jgi:HrpA-like RNA helicase